MTYNVCVNTHFVCCKQKVSFQWSKRLFECTPTQSWVWSHLSVSPEHSLLYIPSLTRSHSETSDLDGPARSCVTRSCVSSLSGLETSVIRSLGWRSPTRGNFLVSTWSARRLVRECRRLWKRSPAQMWCNHGCSTGHWHLYYRRRWQCSVMSNGPNPCHFDALFFNQASSSDHWNCAGVKWRSLWIQLALL